MVIKFMFFLCTCLSFAAAQEQAVTSTPELAPEVIEEYPAKEKKSVVVSGFVKKLFQSEEDEDRQVEGAENPETEESQGGIPEALSPEGDTGQTPDLYLPAEYLSASRRWEAPKYTDQTNALGWSPDVFAVPDGLRKRVDFWISIYTKYTTDEGVLHDSDYLNIVYSPIDFRPIMRNTSLSSRQKAKAREKLVNEKRKEIEERLRRLANLKTSTSLSGEDLRLWRLFESVDEPNKFQGALQKGRVRFQLGQKDRFIVGIYYSGRYLHEMESIFKKMGLPIELTRLPFVESSFNIFARSKVGASGVWQFMRRTARPYMMVNSDVDERNDPIEATRASAKMLKSNYQMLGNWPLAVTGYNHGPSGVLRITKKLGTKDITKIISNYSSRSFGFASENFYACFLAALEVEQNARRYFGEVKWSTEFSAVEVAVSRSIPYKALLSWYDGNEDLARLHNFHLQTPVRKGRSSIPRGTFVRVPQSSREAVFAYLQGSIKSVESKRTVRDELGATTKKAAVRIEETRRYKVRRGDHLTRISKEFGVTIGELRRSNNLRSDRLKQGQILIIPD